jgi:hypothetical protein
MSYTNLSATSHPGNELCWPSFAVKPARIIDRGEENRGKQQPCAALLAMEIKMVICANCDAAGSARDCANHIQKLTLNRLCSRVEDI